MPALISPAAVSFIRKEVAELKPRWDLVRHCVAGQERIKAMGPEYLPKPNADDKSDENDARYKQYKDRAVFYNVTGRTLSGLVGQVFLKDPVAVLPSALEILIQDVDGGGVELNQQAKLTLSFVLQFGRCGLLVDYPKTQGATSIAEQEAGAIRPTVILWQPWDVINWRVGTFGGKKLLTLVVISERYVTDDDGFEAQLDDQYRVLKLDDAGNYYVEIWRRDESKQAEWVIVESFYPTNAAGQLWREIPFTFVGAVNNDPTPDLPPLYDLATLNVAHYRNSADYEEAAYMLGQPTPWIAGLSENWVKTVLKGKIQLGSRAVIPLPENGSAGLLQVSPNTMPKEAMEHKEAQMVALGAKLVESRSVQQTATEANQNEASEVSVLSTAAANVSSAYSKALAWAGQFAGATGEASLTLNTDFEMALKTAQDRAQLVAEWQGNAITFTEMREGLKRAGVAYQDDEEARAEMESDGINLGVPVGSAASQAAEAAKAQADAAAKVLAAKNKQTNPGGGAPVK